MGSGFAHDDTASASHPIEPFQSASKKNRGEPAIKRVQIIDVHISRLFGGFVCRVAENLELFSVFVSMWVTSVG